MDKYSFTSPNVNFWRDKKVLVTGHTGFKGSWLSLWLLKMESKVSGISLNSLSNSLFEQLKIKKDINHILCDIRDKDSLKSNIEKIKPDIVFHLAAQPLVVDSYKDPIYTWETNVMGTLNVLDSITSLRNDCAGIFITTDKVYKNNEWLYGYRENDELGGHDPYSSSKAASEIAISSWRSSFLDINNTYKSHLRVASARAGNVIGGGDWAENRIIPDVIRSLQNNQKIKIRNPMSTRPWQHVLEPISGYLLLAEKLEGNKDRFSSAFNFGPFIESNRNVKELVEESIKFWPGEYIIDENLGDFHEAGILNLSIEKSINNLNWRPKWNFNKTVEMTMNWYKNVFFKNKSPLEISQENLEEYLND